MIPSFRVGFCKGSFFVNFSIEFIFFQMDLYYFASDWLELDQCEYSNLDSLVSINFQEQYYWAKTARSYNCFVKYFLANLFPL